MKFEINGRYVLKAILLIHVGLALFDLRFLIIPWIFILGNLWTLYTKPLGGQWVPADINKIRRMLEIAKLKPGEVLYDLGSGDGRIIAEAIRRYKVKAVGVEIDWLRVLISRLKLRLEKLDRQAQIKHGNLFDTDLRDADVVTLYLLPATVNKLKSKFKKELKSGSHIVSLQFPISNWKPIKVDKKLKIFVYKI